MFHVQNAATLTGFGSGIDNAGTFRKSANAGTTTLATNVNLNNYATVEIRSGILLAWT